MHNYHLTIWQFMSSMPIISSQRLLINILQADVHTSDYSYILLLQNVKCIFVPVDKNTNVTEYLKKTVKVNRQHGLYVMQANNAPAIASHLVKALDLECTAKVQG